MGGEERGGERPENTQQGMRRQQVGAGKDSEVDMYCQFVLKYEFMSVAS